MAVKLIVAYDQKRGIGRAGAMAWHIPGESKWTARTTKKTSSAGSRNALIMGRTTYFSLPAQRRPLIDRANIVVSTNAIQVEPGAYVADSFHHAIELADSMADVEDAFVFGGESIYRQALEQRIPEEILISEIDGDYHCDRFFPALPQGYILKSTTTARYDEHDVRHDHFVRDGL